MKKTLLLLQNFFTKPLAIETLGFFRIAVSAFALTELFVLLPDWMLFYGPQGIVPWQISEAIASSHMPTLTAVMQFLSPLHISAGTTLYIVSIIYFLSLVGLLLGFKSRLMGILAWLMHLILNTTGHLTAYGVESFMHISLFYCAVLPVGVVWSFDATKNKKPIAPYLVTLSIRIIQLHLCIMYLASGIEKGLGHQWWNGDAIWIALQQDQFNQVNINWMADLPWIPKLLGWSTLLVETFYPVGIFWAVTKRYWLMAILSMHLFIALFLGLHLFGALMILLNFSAFAQHSFPQIFKSTYKMFSFRKLQSDRKLITKLFNEY